MFRYCGAQSCVVPDVVPSSISAPTHRAHLELGVFSLLLVANLDTGSEINPALPSARCCASSTPMSSLMCDQPWPCLLHCTRAEQRLDQPWSSPAGRVRAC